MLWLQGKVGGLGGVNLTCSYLYKTVGALEEGTTPPQGPMQKEMRLFPQDPLLMSQSTIPPPCNLVIKGQKENCIEFKRSKASL